MGGHKSPRSCVEIDIAILDNAVGKSLTQLMQICNVSCVFLKKRLDFLVSHGFLVECFFDVGTHSWRKPTSNYVKFKIVDVLNRRRLYYRTDSACLLLNCWYEFLYLYGMSNNNIYKGSGCESVNEVK